MIPARERKKDKRGGSVYIVKEAGLHRVHGKYVEHPTERCDGQLVYVKTDDTRYRIERKEGVWMLNSYYVCPHGTDTPPSLSWVSTQPSYDDPPTVRCLQP